MAELVERARRGHRDAFDELVRRHLRAAYAVAFAVLQTSEAEDVAQESFVAALSKLDRCREPARFSGWLIEIVRQRARSAKRKRVSRERHAVSTANEPAAPDPSLRLRLTTALATLSEIQREVVLLHDLEGLTHAEIADMLQLSEVSSRQYLFTARQALRGVLGKETSRARI